MGRTVDEEMRALSWLELIHACLSQAAVENCLLRHSSGAWEGGIVDEEGRALSLA